jgi:glycosyltransferase involved in cell wall biosynthesis
VKLTQPHIGLNAHLLNLSGNYRSAGISWYIYHLIQNLALLPNFDYTAFLSDRRAPEHFAQTRIALAQSRLPTHKPLVRIAWEQFIQPFALRQHRIDLLHAMAFAGPMAINIPWVVTIYDLSFVHYPQLFNVANRRYLTWAVRNAVHRANQITVISESTKRDLVKMFGASPEKIHVVYCGSDPAFKPKNVEEQFPTFNFQLPISNFVLHVGTIEPRKNHVRLVRAFARAKREYKLPHKLVLIGARGWMYEQVDAVIEQEDMKNEIIFAGYIPQNELPLWHRSADLFVYPSLYEGFGLPALEAMASGTPVITSNASSLPEVVGDAAVQVAPEDENALAQAIGNVLTNPGLREQMIARGLAQAAKFSWARAARETVDVYRLALKEPHAA